MRSAVVLPAPFGPITAKNSPASTAKLTPLAAATPPKLTWRSSMRASAVTTPPVAAPGRPAHPG